MFCKNCGAQIADGAGFCPKCGAKLASTPAATAQPQRTFNQQPQASYGQQMPQRAYAGAPAQQGVAGQVAQVGMMAKSTMAAAIAGIVSFILALLPWVNVPIFEKFIEYAEAFGASASELEEEVGFAIKGSYTVNGFLGKIADIADMAEDYGANMDSAQAELVFLGFLRVLWWVAIILIIAGIVCIVLKPELFKKVLTAGFGCLAVDALAMTIVMFVINGKFMDEMGDYITYLSIDSCIGPSAFCILALLVSVAGILIINVFSQKIDQM